MPALRLFVVAAGIGALVASSAAPPPRVMENLGRGVAAIRTSETDVYVGWRLLGTDPAGLAFNLYRSSGAATPVKLNVAPLLTTTDFVDSGADLTEPNSYAVRPVLDGVELAASAPFTLPANAPIQQYLSVPIQRPAGGSVEVPPGSPTSSFTYNANDAAVADLDGDGEYEIVLKWDPSNSRDSASAGLSGHQILDGYKLDGTRLWRIDLGRNIRAGAHDTQFMVYDLDGDGRAELVCKTADGTVDGRGDVIGDAGKQLPDDAARSRVVHGHSGCVERNRLALVLVDAEHLETGSLRIQIAHVQGIAMPESGRKQSAPVVVHHHRAVDNLVAAVAVHVRNRQVVIAHAGEGRRVGIWERTEAGAGIKGPAVGQRAVPPVPCRQHRSAVIAARHHDAGQPPVEICDGGEEPVGAIAVAVVVPVAADPAPPVQRVARSDVRDGCQRGSGETVEIRQIFGPGEDFSVARV